MCTISFPFRAIVVALCLLGALEIHAETKIGIVDVDRVFKEYKKTKEAEAKLNEARNAAKKEYDDRAEGYKKALEEINKLNGQLDAPALTAEAKAAKAKERDDKIAKVKNMEREITEFRQTREQQLQQQMVRLREVLLKEIMEVVTEREKARGLDLVIDKSGASTNGFSPILFSPESMDFTTEVITELNKKGNAPTSSPSPRKP
jgi:Skp family chaperone for outer membrane proteins